MFFGILLCLPLLHLGWLLAQEFRAYLDPSPAAWAEDMQAIIRADETLALPEKPVLVVGGRRVVLWNNLPAMLAPYPTLLRGLGDATIEDLTHYYDRLIGFYRPDILVLLPGYADLHLRDNKTPEDLVDAVRTLVTLNRQHLATAMVYVIAPLKMPLHPDDDARIEAMGRALAAWAARESGVALIDANGLLTTASGRPDPALYSGDGINLNEAGYLRLAMVLREALHQGHRGAAPRRDPDQ
ncbi:GDSL-type esterase/lipase family protein [Pseudohaliea rubra]|nr:GDSL-type esterase/lipase family protein [Pseudohaliea rubra]